MGGWFDVPPTLSIIRSVVVVRLKGTISYIEWVWWVGGWMGWFGGWVGGIWWVMGGFGGWEKETISCWVGGGMRRGKLGGWMGFGWVGGWVGGWVEDSFTCSASLHTRFLCALGLNIRRVLCLCVVGVVGGWVGGWVGEWVSGWVGGWVG